MDKFVAFMEKHFIPVASKIGAQRHLVAIRDYFYGEYAVNDFRSISSNDQ
ncbi:hypothetical protein HV547_11240 [Enterococcus faecium]|nr:hypothetical protein [Enterococcus faecium]